MVPNAQDFFRLLKGADPPPCSAGQDTKNARYYTLPCAEAEMEMGEVSRQPFLRSTNRLPESKSYGIMIILQTFPFFALFAFLPPLLSSPEPKLTGNLTFPLSRVCVKKAGHREEVSMSASIGKDGGGEQEGWEMGRGGREWVWKSRRVPR